MSLVKIGTIVTLIVIGFILNIVSVFTKGWIVQTYRTTLITTIIYYGIVPFNSVSAAWFRAASVMMYISFAFYILLILALVNAIRETRIKGYSLSVRYAFNIVTALCIFITILMALSFILMTANASTIPPYGGTLGYSAYLDLISLILTFLAGILAAHVFYYDCRA